MILDISIRVKINGEDVHMPKRRKKNIIDPTLPDTNDIKPDPLPDMIKVKPHRRKSLFKKLSRRIKKIFKGKK